MKRYVGKVGQFVADKSRVGELDTSRNGVFWQWITALSEDLDCCCIIRLLDTYLQIQFSC